MSEAAIRAIEERLDQIPPGSERHAVLESARRFKASWVELGEHLTRVFQQKSYEKWGFESFDRYVTAELHMRRETAHKLVRNYNFVQSARPEYLAPERAPAIEVVDFIAKKREAQEASSEQIESFAKEAFDNSWSPRVVSQKWKSLTTDDNRAEAPIPIKEDKAQRAVRRARELAEKLSVALLEVPGLDQRAIDSLQDVVKALDEAAA